jgi:hypothetical protein
MTSGVPDSASVSTARTATMAATPVAAIHGDRLIALDPRPVRGAAERVF